LCARTANPLTCGGKRPSGGLGFDGWSSDVDLPVAVGEGETDVIAYFRSRTDADRDDAYTAWLGLMAMTLSVATMAVRKGLPRRRSSRRLRSLDSPR
jgi:hypothetical protein